MLRRYLWTEAVMHAAAKDTELKRFYGRKLIQKAMGKAGIAAARKLGIRLGIMIATRLIMQSSVAEDCGSGEAHAGMPDYDSGPALQ